MVLRAADTVRVKWTLSCACKGRMMMEETHLMASVMRRELALCGQILGEVKRERRRGR